MKKYVSIFVLFSSLLFNIHPTFGQMWLPRGDSLIENPYTTCTSPDALYLAFIERDSSNPNNKNIIIYKWNGVFGTYLPTLQVPNRGDSLTVAMCWYKNELYVGGNFDSLAGISKSNHIVRFNGNFWKNVGKGFGGADYEFVSDMEIYKNELYVGGYFTKLEGNPVSNIARWNGTNWGIIGTAGNEGTNNAIFDLQTYNDTLYVGGVFSKASSVITGPIAKWDNTSWKPSNFNGKKLKNFAVFNNEIYAAYIRNDSALIEIYKQNGKNWYSATGGLNKVGFQINSFLSFNNNLYLLAFDTFNFKFSLWNGSQWNNSPQITAPKYINWWGKNNLLVWKDRLFLSGVFIDYQGSKLVNLLEYTKIYGNVSGLLYADYNNNCIRDTLENGIKEHFVEINQGPPHFITNKNGYFNAYVDTGTYTIKPIRNKGSYKYWHLSSCNPTEYNVHVSIGSIDSNNYFALLPTPNVQDSRIFLTGLTGFWVRPGRTENYSIEYENIGTKIISSGTVNLKLDNRVVLKTSNPNYDSYTHPNLTWSFSDLKPLEKRTIRLSIKVDSSISVNDSIIYAATILPLTGDSDITNNYDTLKQRIVTAIDPNDKQCSPEGNILPSTEKIDYLIRFQNTGNHVAYRVRVVDTVTENLPLTKVLLKTASHPYELSVKDNVLLWTFNDIMLADSTSDEPNSHGYIRYTAFLKSGLGSGTKITNKAYIYFDYQSPVITKATENIIALPVSIDEHTIIENKEYKVYPNPASGHLNIIYLGKNQKQELSLVNSFGQMISGMTLNPGKKKEIDISKLPNGLYLIRDNKSSSVNKIIISH